MMAKNIVTQIYDTMNTCIDVRTASELFAALVEEGHGDAMLGYRIGRTATGLALSFPVASFRADSDGKFIMLTPIPFKDENESEDSSKDFDTVVDFKEETIELSIVEYSEKEKQDDVQ